MRPVLASLAALVACGDNIGEAPFVQSGSRLRLITYDLADGSQAIDSRVMFDRERREDCRVELFASGERHCMPVTAGGTTVFTESTCRRVLGAARVDQEPPRYFIRRFLLRGLELPSRLYVAGAPVQAPELVWRQQDEFCLGPYPADTLLAYYDVGDEIPDRELARVRVDETLAGERLSLALDASDDGWRMPGALHDDLLELPCELAPSANDDVARCIPTDVPATTYFADASCSTPLVTVEPMLHHDRTSGCTSVLESGEPYTGAVYELLAESCVASPRPGTIFTAAAAAPVAELPRIRHAGNRLVPIELGGFREPLREPWLFDRALDADCAIVADGDGFACVPHQPLPVRTFFRDAECTATVDVVFVPTGPCQPRYRFAGGRPIEGVYPDALYEPNTGDRCREYVPPARFEIHALGELTLDLVRATRRPD